MSNRRNIQFHYSPHNKATVLDCNFIVDSANGNGFGVRSLKNSGRIYRVFMNTTASLTGTVTNLSFNITAIAGGTSSLRVGMPVQGTAIPAGTVIASIIDSGSVAMSAAATGSHASETITYQAPGSPNPAAGIILVQLQDNYNRYLGGYAGLGSPLSGSPITSGLTVGKVYVIVSLGSSSAAQWQTAGVPSYIKPAVGVSFIAAATSVAGGGVVELIATAGSGVDHIELVGDPNLMNSQGATVIGTSPGMTLISMCFAAGVQTAPADGTIIGMNFYMNDSAQGV